MNEGSLFLFCFVLFCSYEIHPTGMLLQIMFLGFFGKLLTRREVHGLGFHDVWTCGAKVLDY